MANVMFKRGLSTALPWNSAQDGTFYLTSDTNRLYVGNGSVLAELNRYVKTVATVADLNKLENVHENDFAYITEKNILAVYAPNKDNPNVLEWHQVNVNTNTDTSVTEVSFKDGTVVDADASSGREKSIKVEMTLTQKNKDVLTGVESDAGSITQAFYIPASAFSTMETNAAVTATVSVDNGVATIKNTGTGAAGEGFTISGGENINISGDSAGIVIASSDTTYDLKLDDTEISLVDSNSQQSATRINVVGDQDWIEVTNVNGNIQVAHTSKEVSQPAAVSGGQLTEDTKFTVVTGLTVDDNNHVTGISTTEYEAKDTTYTPSLTLDNNKNLVVALTDQDGSETAATGLDITHKITIDGQEYDVKPGDNLGEIYSKSEIDRQLKALNGMTYKGVVNSESELPGAAYIGDTYKVGTAFTMEIDGSEVNLKVCDLLIVNSNNEEDEAGQVTADIKWDRIESGEAADTTYDLAATNNTITLTDSHGSVDTINVDGDEIITLATSDNELSAAHKTYTQAVATDDGDVSVSAGTSFTAVTDIITDGFGHATGFKTKDFTIPTGDVVVANAADASLTLKTGDSVDQGSIKINAGAELGVTGTSSDSKNLVVEVAHNSITKNDTTGTATPAHEGTFNVVESITYIDYGHVSGVKTTTVTLPKEIEYTMHGAVVADNVATWELKNDAGVVKGNAIAITSSSLKIAANATTQATIELEWGSF